MKRLNQILLAATFVLAFSSCKKDAAVPDQNNEDAASLETLGNARVVDTTGIGGLHFCTIMPGNDKGTDPRGAAITNKKWTNGREITVRMYGGTSYIRGKVVKYAQQWSDYANITFKFVTTGAADIRITFTSGGSYSYIGTDALSIASNTETMNFGWLKSSTAENEFRRVIVHEFGHALGLIHEQQHPLVDIPWDKEAVYAYYAETQGWSRSDVDVNLFQKYSTTTTQYSAYDKLSIMHYSVPNELTIGDFSVGFNTDFSPTDKEFIGLIYPKN